MLLFRDSACFCLVWLQIRIKVSWHVAPRKQSGWQQILPRALEELFQSWVCSSIKKVDCSPLLLTRGFTLLVGIRLSVQLLLSVSGKYAACGLSAGGTEAIPPTETPAHFPALPPGCDFPPLYLLSSILLLYCCTSLLCTLTEDW